ncbi:DUF7666 domain-containing protein [Inconstantimicrobium mannanitabidum]|uniref:Uncharacterized protein n=1 Tax=Inconstantimicrobium mannanitabidum TaxID=1604901 RepID=A0ACB5R998_9CLOT|nr:hypothetical protein [Clostridium sp. TW13]GKX65612.1 hypothetical protein rsdtw13_08700 [Clostridium sp. TW13]
MIKGFKVFENDWTCREYQYEVGKTFKHEGNIEMCGAGFHFCQKASDCFNYYSFNSNNKVAEVEAVGHVETREDKSVTDELRIVREISWQELLTIVNTGKDCTGLNNSGNRNSGDWNSGNRNSGDRNSGNRNSGNGNSGNGNSGDWNSGNRNSGDRNSGNRNSGNGNSGNGNSGNRNSGDRNSGDWNSGDWNSGDRNSGDWNSGNRNSGNGNSGNGNSGNRNSGDRNSGDWNSTNRSSNVFSTKQEKLKIFDKETDMTFDAWRNSEACSILAWNFNSTVWIYEENMTDEEKEKHPSYKTTGGYLKEFTFREACKNMWGCLTTREKEVIENIPNFDNDKFKSITGIEVEKE